MTKIKSDFRLIGLSKPNSATLTFLDTDKTTFWASFNISPDRFKALFKWAKESDDFWKTKWIAEIEHDGYYEDGTPKNPICTGVREWIFNYFW